jgi:hypothetical protein
LFLATTMTYGDSVGDGDGVSQGGYGDGTLEGSGRGGATRAGGQEVLARRSEAGEAPGEAQRRE